MGLVFSIVRMDEKASYESNFCGTPQDSDEKEEPTDDSRVWAQSGAMRGGGNPIAGQCGAFLSQEDFNFRFETRGENSMSSAMECRAGLLGSEVLQKAQIDDLSPLQCMISPESKIAKK